MNPANFILLCHTGSSIFLVFFFFGTNKRYNSALHKTIKLCFYLSVVLFYFIFSLASRFVFISSYFCSLNGSLIWCEASLLNIQQNKKNKPTISLNLIFHSFQSVQFSILLFCYFVKSEQKYNHIYIYIYVCMYVYYVEVQLEFKSNPN